MSVAAELQIKKAPNLLGNETGTSYAENHRFTRKTAMAKVNPFHSKLPGTEVYHNNNRCTLGNNIEARNKVSGTGNLRLCQECRGL